MATVKEVKVLKDGQMITPKTLVDSVYNSDGTKYKDSIYTKTESNNLFTRLPKVYNLTENISGNKQLKLNLNIGDIAFVSGATFDAYSSLSIVDTTSTSTNLSREYLVYVFDSNFPDAEINTFSLKRETNVLYSINKNRSGSYTTNLSLFVMRLK